MDNDTEEDLKTKEEASSNLAAEDESASAAPAADEKAGAPAAEDAAGQAADEKAPDPAALAAALAAEKDRNVRLYADFENFRRRMERERLETWSRAEHDLLAGLLSTADQMRGYDFLDYGLSHFSILRES